MVKFMNYKTKTTILATIDHLTAYHSQLQGAADCLDALSYRYDPGDDLALLAETLEEIAAGLNAAAEALTDITASGPGPKTEEHNNIVRLHLTE